RSRGCRSCSGRTWRRPLRRARSLHEDRSSTPCGSTHKDSEVPRQRAPRRCNDPEPVAGKRVSDMAKTNKKTTKYQVTFILKVEGDYSEDAEEKVEEAVTRLIDEKILSGQECFGVKFEDAEFFNARRDEG